MTDIVERLKRIAGECRAWKASENRIEAAVVEAAAEIERLRTGLRICKQHAGWLTQYAGMCTENNWRDIQLRVEDQTDQLHEDIDKVLAVPSPPIQEEGE